MTRPSSWLVTAAVLIVSAVPHAQQTATFTEPQEAMTHHQIRINGSDAAPPTFRAFLDLVAGRTPIICELKSQFDGDWRVADRAAALAAAYDGPLAFKSFDHDLVDKIALGAPR